MNPPRRRPGATLVEALVAGAVFLVVLAGAWSLFSTSRRQAEQVLEYSSILQAATSVATRLQLDLAATWVPNGADANSATFQVGTDGRSLAFLRCARVDDAAEVAASGAGRRQVRWALADDGSGGQVLTRELPGDGGERQVWPGAPLKDLRFQVYRAQGKLYVSADFLFLRPASPGGGPEREFPIRVVRNVARFSGLASGGFPRAPASVQPPTPAAPAALPQLPVTRRPGAGLP